jgi:hypothetical protein
VVCQYMYWCTAVSLQQLPLASWYLSERGGGGVGCQLVCGSMAPVRPSVSVGSSEV